MKQRRPVNLDPAVASILTPPQPSVPAEKKGKRKKQSPHVRDRRARMMSVTFPDPEWCDAIRELAERWDVRPGDIVVYAVSRFFDDLRNEEVEGPIARAGFQDRAGDVFDLPWEPE